VADHLFGDGRPRFVTLSIGPNATWTNKAYSTYDQQIAPLDPLPCPVTVAWPEEDVFIPVASYGPNARNRLPQATFQILPDVGHDPMMDDPALVARTILKYTDAANN
jgi:pimeloyl-ACP methyl ester carboxylesterase